MELATAARTGPRPRLDPAVTGWLPRRQHVGVVLVAAHVAAVLWLVVGGGLYIDDVRAQAYAAGRSWWPFVIESNRTHLSPGARTVDWFMATYAPLAHWPAVVLTAGTALLLGWATLRLTARVIQHPGARTVAVFWVLFAASVLPTYAWFRQTLTTMLPLALILLATSLAIDHARTGRRSAWALSVVCHAGALAFSERALAVPFVVLAVLLVVPPPTRPPPSVAVRTLRAVVVLLPYAVLNVVFLAVYLSGDYDRAERARPGLLDAVQKLGRWAFVDMLPSFVGGPVRWRSIGPYSFADTPLVLVVVAALLLLGLLVAAARTSGSLRAAGPVALGAAAYALPVLALVYVGRLALVDDIRAVDDLRLLPDVSAAVAITLAALLGQVLTRRSAPPDSAPRRRARLGRRSAAVLAAGVVVLTTVTWVGFGRTWHTNTTSEYLDALRTEVAGATGSVLPTPVPETVVPGWVDPAFTTLPLIRLVNPGVTGSEIIGQPQAVTPTGELGPAQLQRVDVASIPPGFCGAAIPAGEQSVSVDFVPPVPYYRGSVVQVGLLVGDASRVGIEAVGRDGTVTGPLVADPPELLRGPHRIYALLPRGLAVASVTVRVEPPNTAGVCVTSVQVSAVGAGQ